MRTRRSVPLVLSCAAVTLAGCGGSSLLDGSSASELQASLSTVRNAIDEGKCSQARTAARAGTQKVDELPSSVDADLRDTLRKGFEDLISRVGTDCETTSTTTTETPTSTVAPPTETTTSTEDTTPTEPDTTPDTAPLEPTTPDTSPTDPSTTDGTDPSLPDGGDDGSGGVVPGVDGPGPGATQRSVPGGGGKGNGFERFKKRLKDARKRAEQIFHGQGGG